MKTKSEKFPLAIKAGSVTVKVYREEKASGAYYRLGFYQAGKRKWEHYSTLDEARSAADAKARQLSRGDMDAAQLTGRDRLIYGRALDALRPLSIALDGAAMEYAEAKIILGTHGIADAARFFMRHHGHGIRSMPVADAVTEMIAAKTAKGVSGLYLADLRYRLGAFKAAFACNVNALAPDDVRDWLASLKLAPRSYNNFLQTLRTFFAFAQSNGWLAREAELLAKVEKRKERSAPVEIFTPSELSLLLTYASPEIAPCIALAAFAGLRSEEILRLSWADVERRPGYVEVSSEKSKTGQRRLVPIAENLKQWLAHAPRKSPRVWWLSKPYFFESLRNAVRTVNKAKAEKCEKSTQTLVWKQNALRHSYISYRLADIQNTAQVALEAGNSPQVIFKNYRELATPAESQAWFSVVPSPASTIT